MPLGILDVFERLPDGQTGNGMHLAVGCLWFLSRCQGRSLRGPSLLHRSPILIIDKCLELFTIVWAVPVRSTRSTGLLMPKKVGPVGSSRHMIKPWSQGLHVPESRKKWREPGLAVGLSATVSTRLGRAASNQTWPYLSMYFQPSRIFQLSEVK